MKKVWLMGGFGNVLFQILAFRILNKVNADAKYVCILTERNIITRLLDWTIHENIYYDFIDKKHVFRVGVFSALFTLVILKFNLKFLDKHAFFYKEDDLFEYPFSDNIFGYFQGREFLINNEKELLKLCGEIREKYKSTLLDVVVHFRCGDFIWSTEDRTYYNQVKELLIKEDGDILVVTDSLKDARLFFKEIGSVNFSSSIDPMCDFKKVISARKLYCAPSTFSWWAAHSLDKDSKIIMPLSLKYKMGVYVNRRNLIIL